MVHPPPASTSLVWQVAIAVLAPATERFVHESGKGAGIISVHFPVVVSNVEPSRHAGRQYGNLSVKHCGTVSLVQMSCWLYVSNPQWSISPLQSVQSHDSFASQTLLLLQVGVLQVAPAGLQIFSAEQKYCH